jgi:transposase, IS5 family
MRSEAMKQTTLAQGGFEKYGKTTRRAVFLEEMDRVVPWTELCALIEPHYPKAGNGRPPIGLERMLRLHFLQHWFNLSDPGLEDALYDSNALRQFAGIDLGREPVPDETTVCKFRHLLERNGLGQAIFARVGELLQSRGFKLNAGTIVDATLISAPQSTKNASGQRDPEMGSTRKGKKWGFGMKAHIGVDHHSKLIHHVVATAGNVADGPMIGQLLHGGEHNVWGDKAYVGQGLAIRAVAPQARNQILFKAQAKNPLNAMQEHFNELRSRVRSRVEHMFGVIKCVFGFDKLRYRGLAKNANRLFTVCALANLFIIRRKLA